MVKDPYRYFRIEAQELLEALGQGILQVEQGRPDPEAVRRLLRHAHTLKGASRVVKLTRTGALAHALEELLAPHRDTGGPIARDSIDRALQLLDEIRHDLRVLDAPPAQPAMPAPTLEDVPALRVAIGDLDVLLDGAFAAQIEATSLRRAVEELAHVHAEHRAATRRSASDPRSSTASNDHDERFERALRKVLDRTERVLTETQEVRATAASLRMIPADTLMADVRRAVRDAARELGKEVDVAYEGGDIHIDAHVLAGVRHALLHLVRNSVAHGIETRAERLAQGKPPRGTVHIALERQGSRARIVCRDDGRGLDLAAIREAAVGGGSMTANAAEALDETALGAFLLRGRVSTSRTVTSVSGRGVGLDAVRDAIEALKGEVTLRSRQGAGVTVELLVPTSLATVSALCLQIDETSVLLPIDSVRRTVRLAEATTLRNETGEHLVVDDTIVPLVPLQRLLSTKSVPSTARSAVLVVSEGRWAAVAVERVAGVRNVVVRPAPPHAAILPIVGGATLDEDGHPQLVLAPARVVEAVHAAAPLHDAASPPALPPLLVIDDSLTTRMLEQSILESAGYPVDVATSGEEGLQKAKQRRYGAFIVDVEMPGMSGFEFVARTRDDPVLREVPAILVTSRSDPEDKRRGKEAGARAYIVKSEFNQSELIDIIRGLVG